MTKSIAAGRSRAWVEVDLDALVRNARRFQEVMGAPLLPMVKADAYGLGAEAVTRALEALEPWGYGLATVEEAATLRRSGISRPLLLCTPLYPQIIHACLTWGVRPSVGSVAMLDAWLDAGGGAFHLAIDTGMSRSGVPWHDEESWGVLASRLGGVTGFEGAYTHFHSPDSDPDSCQVQMDRFRECLARLPGRPPMVHVASSASPRQFGLDLARPGIFLYGGEAPGLVPDPVVRVEARVVSTRRVRAGDTVSYGATWTAKRPGTIATVAMGYADGLPLALARGGGFEIRGEVCPIAGRITMDLTMVDAGDLDVVVGDVATVIGGRLGLSRQAADGGTTAYQVLTALGPRLPRNYRRTA